jgi:uncharacterized protein (TIGR03437 family)
VVPRKIATAFRTDLTPIDDVNVTLILTLLSIYLNHSLIINDKQVARFAVDSVKGQQQINFQVPWEVTSGPNATIAESKGGPVGAPVSVAVLAAQLEIFNYSAGGQTFGAISSPPGDGEPGKGQSTIATPIVTVGGPKAIASFSGLAPRFVDQAVILEVGGTSSNSVLLPVQSRAVKDKIFRKALGLLLLLTPLGLTQTTPDWTLERVPLSPPARFFHAMAYDSTHRQVILYGGTNVASSFNDTWAWDGSQWTQQSPQTSPPLRIDHAKAFDSAHGQIVLFGGNGAAGELNDTWVWDGSNWEQKFPVANPPAREGHVMAYDAAHGLVVLFGGDDGSGAVLGDTWVWDGSNWSQESPQVSPPARTATAMAYDSTRGQAVLFGGSDSTAQLNDTWLWDGANWTAQSPATSPTPRADDAMVFDSAHGQAVLFGGSNLASGGNIAETWTWDGTNWTRQIPNNFPPGRNTLAMAYDSANMQVILFGGSFINTTASYNPLGDTWAWSGGPLPTPVITAVVNGASFARGGVVPGEIATAFGMNLTSSTGINLTSGLPLATTFLTDSLTVNNQPVPLFAVDNVNGEQQYNFQVPWNVTSGPTATVSANNNGTSSASITVPVLSAQPGIFNYSVGGNTFGAILHANFQLANAANPAKPGETVLIYCTGLGAVSSPPADGEPGNGQPTMVTPTIMFGGTKAIVSFSGLAPGFVGLYQINAEVPAALATGNQPVVVEISGASSNSVLLPVQ